MGAVTVVTSGVGLKTDAEKVDEPPEVISAVEVVVSEPRTELVTTVTD